MAENQGENKNSKGIGELFVEFGTKGLPTMLKQLNTVSATFLLGKNAASQFAQTLIQPAKKAGETVTEWRKLNNELGLTYAQIQSMQAWAKKYGISDAILGDISHIENTLYRLQRFGILPPEWYDAVLLLNQAGGLNIDLFQYEDTAEGAIRLLNDIGIGFKKINDLGIKRNILQDFGISLEALDYLKQGKIRYQEMTNMSQKEIDLLLEQKKAVGELEVAWDRFFNTFIAKSSKLLVPVLEQATDMLTPAEDTQQGRTKKLGMWSAIGAGAMGGGMTGSLIGPLGTVGGAVAGGIAGYQGWKALNKNSSETLNIKNTKNQNKNEGLFELPPTEILEYRPDLDQAGISNLSTDGIPADMKSNLISSVTNLNLDAKIYVDGSNDPRATGRGIREELLAQAQYNNIQNRNMTDV